MSNTVAHAFYERKPRAWHVMAQWDGQQLTFSNIANILADNGYEGPQLGINSELTLPDGQKMNKGDFLLKDDGRDLLVCAEDQLEDRFTDKLVAGGNGLQLPENLAAELVTEDTILDVKRLRVSLAGTIDYARELPHSRELSLVVIKLQEARMWGGQALAELGTPNPYPTGNDTTTTAIDPPTDMPAAPAGDTGTDVTGDPELGTGPVEVVNQEPVLPSESTSSTDTTGDPQLT